MIIRPPNRDTETRLSWEVWMSTAVPSSLGAHAGRYGCQCHDNGMACSYPSMRIAFPRVRDQVIAC
jgi:hypothetical protein